MGEWETAQTLPFLSVAPFPRCTANLLKTGFSQVPAPLFSLPDPPACLPYPNDVISPGSPGLPGGRMHRGAGFMYRMAVLSLGFVLAVGFAARADQLKGKVKSVAADKDTITV